MEDAFLCNFAERLINLKAKETPIEFYSHSPYRTTAQERFQY